jgi:hypothetical protein
VRRLLGAVSLGDGQASPARRGLRYVGTTLERPGGNRRDRRRSRGGAVAAALAAAALTLSVAACGGGSSADSNEPAGTYRVKVVNAEFPARQRLGETSLMKVGVRNTGRKALPALAITVSIAGRQGQASSLPFGYRDPEPGLAQPDRPIWVLASGYPRIAGSPARGPIEPSLKKTFVFGPLKPGRTTEAIWKLSAVRAGRYSVLYDIAASLNPEAKARTAAGTEPGGSFTARILTLPPNVEVKDNGEVVEIGGGKNK